MMFAQLASRVSIRDLVENFNTCHNHHYHLGVSRIKRSSLSADTPTFFELTTARRNDGKAAQNLPIMAGVTYVFDRAYDDYSWYHEMVFKWIKQNLKVKRFLGRSENAVKIQVLTAMIAYLLLRLAQIATPCKLSLQQIARRISLNLTRRCSLLELFSDPPDGIEVNLLQNQGVLELAYA